MSKKTIAQLFAQKVEGKEAVLGPAQGDVILDNQKDRHYQLFEHGIVVGKRDINKLADLVCVYGKLFHAWWGNPGAAWLGDPLEDLYETTNFKWDPDRKEQIDGDQIMVQRFERGVIWCRSDGSDDVHWLSWRDWNAISEPGNKSNRHR